MHRPSLAIDFDGVIAETLSRKSAWIARHLGLKVAPAECSKSRCEPRIGAENYRRMGRELGYTDTLECPAFDGAQEGLQRLSKVFAVHVFTARPEEKARWAREWFYHHRMSGLIEEVVCTYGRSKAKLAETMCCRALVDNDIRHLREKTAGGMPRIYFCPTGVSHSDEPSVTSVGGWSELVNLLLPECSVIRGDRLPSRFVECGA